MSKLPKSLTRVTAFSKLIALFMFVAFITSAFYAGMLFQKKAGDLTVAVATPTPQIASEQVACQTDTDCVLANTDQQALCCPNTRCLDFSKESVVAVNGTWFNNLQKNACVGKMCPMIAAICTKQITEGNQHYSAKCVNSVCQKVRE